MTREWTTHERSREQHMLEAKESSPRRHLMTHPMTWPTLEMTCESPHFFISLPTL